VVMVGLPLIQRSATGNSDMPMIVCQERDWRLRFRRSYRMVAVLHW